MNRLTQIKKTSLTNIKAMKILTLRKYLNHREFNTMSMSHLRLKKKRK